MIVGTSVGGAGSVVVGAVAGGAVVVTGGALVVGRVVVLGAGLGVEAAVGAVETCVSWVRDRTVAGLPPELS